MIGLGCFLEVHKNHRNLSCPLFEIVNQLSVHTKQHTHAATKTHENRARDAREIFGCHPLSDKLCIFMYDNETAVGISNQHALKVTASAAKRDHQSSHLIHKHRDSVCDMGSDWLCAPGRNSFYGIMICKLFMDQYRS